MDSDTQTRMFYPSPKRASRRVRGPKQPIGSGRTRQLHILTTKVMSFATKQAFLPHEKTFEESHAAMLAETQ